MSYQIQNFNVNDVSAYLTGVNMKLSENIDTEKPASCISVKESIYDLSTQISRIIFTGIIYPHNQYKTYLKLKNKRIYRVIIPNKWEHGLEDGQSDMHLEIYTVRWVEGVSTKEYDIYFQQDTNSAKQFPEYIDITVPDDYDYTLGIYINIKDGLTIFFDVYDVTELVKIEQNEESFNLMKNKSFKNITEYTSNDGYITTSGDIYVVQTYSYTNLIYLTKGSIINAILECWNDQCAIGYKQNISDSKYTILSLGQKNSNNVTTSEYHYVMENDGYISFSYAKKSNLILDIQKLNIADDEILQNINTKISTYDNIFGLDRITYEGSDFEKISGKMILFNKNISDASTCFISKPLYFMCSDTISIGVECWGDMATIAKTDEFCTSVSEIISLGGGQTHSNNIHDYYTYNHIVTENGYYVVTGIWTDNVLYKYTQTKSQFIDRINDSIYDTDLHSDLLPLCEYVSVDMDIDNDIQNWTGQQIIDNIYEPLRNEYPQYIKRKSIGKSGDYDIWLYEFCNSIEEWFSLNNVKNISENILLPSTNNLSSKQVAILKTTFDTTFSMNYENLYPLSTFKVRKPSLAQITEKDINGSTYTVLTCEDDIKVTDNTVNIYWSTKVKTYDQHAFIVSGVHADENTGYIGTALALKYMIEHHNENSMMNYIFNNVKLSVVPILNVWGSMQTPKSRISFDNSEMNRWKDTLNQEQTALDNYINTIKDELSFYGDFHTAEWWSNYGYVYAIASPHQKIIPGIVSAANFLCRHWFPNTLPLNWNIGQSSGFIASSVYMYEKYNIESATIEFNGQDIMNFLPCERYSKTYINMAIENYLNFLLSMISMRVKSNLKNIKNNLFFEHTTMS